MAVLAVPVFADGTPPPAAATPPKISYAKTAIALADQLLQQKAKPEAADEAQFETENGFADFKGLKDAFESAVAKGADIVANGVKPGTPVFALLLAENTGATPAPSPAVAPKDPTPKDNAPDATTTPTDPNAPLLAGLKDLRGASRTQILFLAHVYRIPPPGFEAVKNQTLKGQVTTLDNKWDTGIELLQNGLELDAIARLASPPKDPKLSADAAAAAAKTATNAAVAEYRRLIPVVTPNENDPFPDSFTALLTAHGNAVIAGTAAKATAAAAAAAAADAKAKATAAQAAATKAGADPDPTTPPTAGSKPTPIIDPATGAVADTVLRNFGISFGAGIGTVASSHSSPVIESAILRWNWIQQQATIRWNDRQTVGGQGSKRVGYGLAGIQGTKLMESKYGLTAKTKDMESLFWESDWVPTSFGPFFGTAVPGNYATFGHNPDGTVIKERPYLAGLQLGWLFYDEAGSLVYLDFGASVSPNSGFRYSRPYIGISADGIVLLKLLDGLRSFVPGTTGTTGGN